MGGPGASGRMGCHTGLWHTSWGRGAAVCMVRMAKEVVGGGDTHPSFNTVPNPCLLQRGLSTNGLPGQ